MRKVATMFVLAGAAGGLFVPPAHADTAVGGARLAGRGYVWDHRSGVPEPPHIEASSYVIADLETGNVLAAKDPHGHYRPASTLKTLTAITLIPKLDPQMKVRPSVNAVDASGSAVGLDVKLSYTVKDLFHGLLMQSGNDAAIALCEAFGGLKPSLAAMNAEAHRIQALDTVARTPNGLDDDPPLTLREQHSSAYDLALIMKQGLTLPDFRKYVGATLYHWPALPTKEERKKGKKTGGYEIGTHDHLLLGNRYPGMIGGKNGWTSHALGSFVGAATRGGHTIIIALMHAQSDFWPDARALLNWGFAERTKAAPVGTLVNPIPPPPTPTPSAKAVASKPAAVLETPPAHRLDWWKIGVPAGAGAAIIGGIALGLRRRRRTSVAGPPFVEEFAVAAIEAPAPPRGDVKVAGAPLSPDGRSTVAETAPNPVQEPDVQDDGEDTQDTVVEEVEETVAPEWTLRIPESGRKRGPFQPPDDEERSPEEPGAESTHS